MAGGVFSQAVRRVCAVMLVVTTCVPSVSADAWWIFFADTPGRRPGDLVSGESVARVKAAGGCIRTVSRYFNAVSVDFKGTPIARKGDPACTPNGDPYSLSRIPGVTGVRRVRAMGHIPRPIEQAVSFLRKTSTTALDTTRGYGVLYDELRMLDIPALHDRGYTGKGVLIGVLETGFDKYKETGCLKGVRVRAERNFVRGGTDVSGDAHGTWVLACLGSSLTGEYRGVAPGASFLLAVTDDTVTETHADEDRWVAAVEWCDSLGADIILSSLVYNEFDTPEESYTKAQMDGHTSLVARTAEIAIARGITVVNSAGNEGALPWRIITTPGDAEHVIAVGAVTVTAGTPAIAPFSSRGPTADGRIKPDVVAPGVAVSVPVPGETGSYMSTSGTSLAAPFIAGLCALLLEAHPDWLPASVMAALKKSARDLGDSGPDNDYGWGLPNGPAALNAFATTVNDNAASEHIEFRPFTLLVPYPNPFNPRVTVPFRLSREARVVVEVFAVTGARVAVIHDGIESAGAHEAVWDASGCAAGVYLVRARADGYAEMKRVVLVK